MCTWWRQWKHFPRYWPFVRGIHRSSVNSPHKGQWRGALMSSLIWAWMDGWVNNREAGDLRRHRAHYDVKIMIYSSTLPLIGSSMGIHIRNPRRHRLRWLSRTQTAKTLGSTSIRHRFWYGINMHSVLYVVIWKENCITTVNDKHYSSDLPPAHLCRMRNPHARTFFFSIGQFISGLQCQTRYFFLAPTYRLMFHWLLSEAVWCQQPNN